jgi:hypothetical protein
MELCFIRNQYFNPVQIITTYSLEPFISINLPYMALYCFEVRNQNYPFIYLNMIQTLSSTISHLWFNNSNCRLVDDQSSRDFNFSSFPF